MGGGNHVRVAFIIIIIIGFLLLKTGATDADFSDERTVQNNYFRAGTLVLHAHSTATNENKSTLFYINGLAPDGFDLQTLRIDNAGTLKSSYTITTQIDGGDAGVCDSLTIAMYTTQFNKKFEGRIADLQLSNDSKEKHDDWIFSVRPKQGTTLPKGKQCSFLLSIVTSGTTSGGKGFYDKKTVHNSIYTAQ